jgi:hypothetical protein
MEGFRRPGIICRQEKIMGKRKIVLVTACAFTLCLFLACNKPSDAVVPEDQQATDGVDNGTGVVTGRVADALAGNYGNHEEAADYTWNSTQVVSIVFSGNAITVNGTGATADGGKVLIRSAGTYSFSGTLADGQIIVNAEDKAIVRLILNGVDISCSTSSPLVIQNAKKAIVVLADGTRNALKDGASYVFADPAENEPNAAVFSKSDLTICGNGSLAVNGNFNDGISSKDGLIIKSGTVAVTAKDDGIRGRDYLIVQGGKLAVTAGGDGLKSDNDEDASRGYILIVTGEITVTSGGDAIGAQTDALIADGQFTLMSGGGSSRSAGAGTSAKGIKGLASTVIDGGTATINSADDAIHSNGRLSINGGAFTISTGDDGVHADTALAVNGGDIRITKSFEGIESMSIAINAGNIHIVSSDDGLNAAGGDAGTGGGGPGQGPGGGFMPAGSYWLYINGGYVAITAGGDGLDINGSINMTDGVVIVHGPTSNANGAVDYDRLYKMTGGTLVAAGSSGMAQVPSTSSTQYAVLLNFAASLPAGTLFHIQGSGGEDVLTFKPAKPYQSVAFSSSKLKNGFTYNVYYGGSSTGTASDGLCQDGTYTPGTSCASFTVSGIVTKVNIK